MSNPFASPGSTSGLDLKTLNGTLLLIEPISLETGVKTSLGDKDAIRANVAVLDGPDAGTEINDALVFPRVLIGQLRSRVGQRVLGRLGQGVPKPGQSAPWILHEATAADVEIGTRWLASHSLATPAAAAQGSAAIPF
jgi:hypothetical protein